MPITEIDGQLIEKHLDKSLSESEQAQFRQRLDDTDFVAELALYQKSVYAIQAAGDKKLKSLLMLEEVALNAPPQYDNALFIPDNSRRLVKQLWWAMAAAFLILILVGYWFFNATNDFKKGNKEKIFAAHFEHFVNKDNINFRTKGEVESDLDKAFLYYDNKDYKKALMYFEKTASAEYDAPFYQAIAYLATQELDKAILILEKISQNTASNKQKQAEWYLALALSETQPEKATRLFEKIKSDTLNRYQKEATAVLKQSQ